MDIEEVYFFCSEHLPACSVVWEGEGCEAFPYPDFPLSDLYLKNKEQ